jgi:hypothetical protein
LGDPGVDGWCRHSHFPFRHTATDAEMVWAAYCWAHEAGLHTRPQIMCPTVARGCNGEWCLRLNAAVTGISEIFKVLVGRLENCKRTLWMYITCLIN